MPAKRKNRNGARAPSDARAAAARNILETRIKQLKTISYASLLIGLIAMVVSLFVLFRAPAAATNSSTLPSLPSTVTLTGSLITPQTSLPDAPVITANAAFGSRLTNINAPLNSSELNIFNNAPNSYFEKAGEMYLNHTLNNTVGISATNSTMIYVNNKPSVVYLGAISCIWCGENRWAMALALGRFGNFSELFKGYSALQDGDVPTLYWAPAHYNASGYADFGNFYTSDYINFISVDYASPIKAGFQLPQSLQYFVTAAKNTSNTAYETAMQLIVRLNNFQGTPYTIWGKFSAPGADAVAFGNSPPSSQSEILIANMTHEQMLSTIAAPNSQLAWTEYAGADIYIAMMCASMNNTAPVCSLPAITQIEKQNGYT